MRTSRRIAVAGATGRLGRHVVGVLRAGGHDVVPISRATGVDVITGDGLDAALAGVGCIVDAATGASADQAAATEFFTTASRNLHAAGESAGVGRMVMVSIIGCDKFTAGYSAAKAEHERAALAGPLPVRVLRAAQFHEFIPVLMAWGRQGDVCYMPKMRTQLIAARAVAESIAELATASEWAADHGEMPEVAGPREESIVEAAGLVAARSGEALRVQGVSNPDDPEHLEEAGALLPGPHAKLRGPTFADWLDAQPS